MGPVVKRTYPGFKVKRKLKVQRSIYDSKAVFLVLYLTRASQSCVLSVHRISFVYSNNQLTYLVIVNDMLLLITAVLVNLKTSRKL